MTTESVAQPTPWAKIDVPVIGATPGQEQQHRKTRTWWCSGASARYGLPVTGLGFNASCPARLQPIQPSASSRLQPHSVSLDDRRGGAMAACECRGMSGIAFTAELPIHSGSCDSLSRRSRHSVRRRTIKQNGNRHEGRARHGNRSSRSATLAAVSLAAIIAAADSASAGGFAIREQSATAQGTPTRVLHLDPVACRQCSGIRQLSRWFRAGKANGMPQSSFRARKSTQCR